MGRKLQGQAAYDSRRGCWVARVQLTREPKRATGRYRSVEFQVLLDGKPLTSRAPWAKRRAQHEAERTQEAYSLGSWTPPGATPPTPPGVGTTKDATPTTPRVPFVPPPNGWQEKGGEDTRRQLESTPTPTVQAFVLGWLSRQSYPSVVKDRQRVESYLGRTSLADLDPREVRPRHLVGFLEELRALPSGRGGTLAPRTQRNLIDPLRRAFAAGVLEEVLESDPWASVPRGARPRVRDKAPEDRAGWVLPVTSLASLVTDPRVPLYRRALWGLLALTGARPGEVAALRWSDLDLALKPLGRVTYARSISHPDRVEKATKTEAIKHVPIHPALARVLKVWFESGWAERYHRAPRPGDRVVPARGETLPHLRQPNVHRLLQADAKRLELPGPEPHPYCLRHSFISMCRDFGCRAEVASRWTHGPDLQRDGARGAYGGVAWDTHCAEVKKLKLGR